jgi:steroid delta-isomerase-like uncharacterized protein
MISVNPVLYLVYAQNNPSNSTILKQQQSNPVEENKILVRLAIEEIFNKHNLTAADKYIAKNLAQGQDFDQGLEALKEFFHGFFTAFPDSHATIEHIIGEDDNVLVFLNWTGTHKGEFQGKMPTDKPITMRTAHIFRIEDGKIAENREISDTLNLLRQIGVITFNYTRDS